MYGYSRHSRARQRAAESNIVVSRDNSRSVSRVRATSEFHRDSPAVSPHLPTRQFGVPDYRSTSVELRTTSPCRGAGGYYPRTTKRTISITTLHNNDQVPIYSRGYDANVVTHLEDITSAYPSLSKDTFRRSASVSKSVGKDVNSTHTPYLGSYYSSLNSDNSNFRPTRFRESTPVRYSSTPRFSSRFL